MMMGSNDRKKKRLEKKKKMEGEDKECLSVEAYFVVVIHWYIGTSVHNNSGSFFQNVCFASGCAATGLLGNGGAAFERR